MLSIAVVLYACTELSVDKDYLHGCFLLGALDMFPTQVTMSFKELQEQLCCNYSAYPCPESIRCLV